MNHRQLIPVLVVSLMLMFGASASAHSAASNPGLMTETIRKAQGSDLNWSPPTNLSRSGSSTNPQMLVDESGLYHVLWEDEIDGFVYARGGIDGWSSPGAVELPFFTRRIFPDLGSGSATPRFIPTLVAGDDDRIHAFWVDDRSGAAPALVHSSVPADSFARYDAWSMAEVVQIGVNKPAAVADESGIHLVYMRQRETSGTRAGIYYQKLPIGGDRWSSARLLYESRYLRSKAAVDGNVDLATLGNGRLIAAWDDAGREMVFAAQSKDGGNSWTPTVEIDRRSADDVSSANGPGRIIVGGIGSQAVVIWQAGHQPSGVCTQYYRRLPADGSDWSLPQILPGLSDCLTSAQFLDDEALLYLFGTKEQSGVESATMIAWDGQRWSDPRSQPNLFVMKNPDTNQPISLACLNAVSRVDQLSVVGCDSGVGGDIWWTTRLLGDTTAWFSLDSEWNGPDIIAGTQLPASGIRIVSDANGASHAFWFEPESSQIFYARWDGAAWSSAAAIVDSGGKPIGKLAVTSDNTRLYLVYSSTQGLFFTQAAIDRPLEWANPVALSTDKLDVTDPTIFVSSGGELIASYAVSLNEPRGIYYLRSTDLGSSWSEPFRIFNGPAAGWEAVGHVQLAETEDGRFHAVWTQNTLPPENAQQAIAYSHSDDNGLTWTPMIMVNKSPSLWAELLVFGERSLHILWAENQDGRMAVWDINSADSGSTWSGKTQVATLSLSNDPAAAFDPIGQLHFLGLENGDLMAWKFDGADWRPDGKFSTNLPDGGTLGAAVDIAGRLNAVYGVAAVDSSVGTATGAVYSISRHLALPAEALPTPPPPSETATPTPTIAPTSTPEPTATIVLPTTQDSNPISAITGANNRAGQIAIAVVPALLVVLLVIGLGFRAMRRGGR